MVQKPAGKVVQHDVAEPAYQPIVELRTERVVAFEALGRAESRNAFARAVAALDTLPPSLLVAVTVSPVTIRSGRFLAAVAGVDARRLIIQLTEDDCVRDHGLLAARFHALRALGARVSVSISGAGISTLPHVARIGPEIIKLERSLTAEAAAGGPLALHARGVVSYAQTVDVPVIATGIDSEDHMQAVLGLGISLGEGDLLAAPHSLDHWSARLRLPASAEVA